MTPTEPVPTQPSTARLLARGATKRCPACGRRGLFRRWVYIVDDCPRCGLHFERIEGHWIGAIGINTMFSFGALLVSIAAGLIATIPDTPVGPLMVLNLTVAAVVPLAFYPISKTLWTAIDIAMRPLEPHEVDWMALGSDTGAGQNDALGP